MSKALVIGSVALDSVETPYGTVDSSLGGSASYGSVAASYFAPTSLVAVVGTDFPKKYVTWLRNRGINLEGLKVENGETFHWSGFYETTMSQAFTNTTALNVFEHFRPDLTPRQAKERFVFLANIDPELQLHVINQLTNPELVVLDTMNFWIEGSKQTLAKVIKKCGLLLMNEEESRQFCETRSLIKAGEELLKMGPRTVVIKKGEHGSLIFQKDGVFSVPAFPLRKMKDPTGAGDTFAGSLTGYVARLRKATPENIRRAVIVGTAMASFVVEDFSLKRTLRIKPDEFQSRVEALYAMTVMPKLNGKSLKPYAK
ncbi:MAG: hypothetical protein PWP23_1202 [Candidatus Sumerlaeota bacterium]|nr:hypothetical protein [Candidatus Sumerlaeota bacterium]